MADKLDYSLMFKVPDSLQEHPELISRGIVVCDIIKPVGFRFLLLTFYMHGPLTMIVS